MKNLSDNFRYRKKKLKSSDIKTFERPKNFKDQKLYDFNLCYNLMKKSLLERAMA